MVNTTIANFAQIDGAARGLCDRSGTATFYVLTPAKGARVDGIASVGMTSHQIGRGGDGQRYPAVYFDFTPGWSRDSGEHDTMRYTLVINGREHGDGFGESVSGYVELLPLADYAHLAERYGHTVIAVDGVDYVMSFRLGTFDSVTDAGRALLEALAFAIAAEYITDVRWWAFRVDSEARTLGYRADDLAKAQAAHDEAYAAHQAAVVKLAKAAAAEMAAS
jgi:hypothetical protein